MIRAVLAAIVMAGAAMAEPKITLLEYEDLDGWQADDHAAALDVFRNTCRDLRDPQWARLCAMAAETPDPRAFFELFFRPVLSEDGASGLITGYYEPELTGALTQSDRFRWPLYRKPPEVEPGTPWLTRREIEESAALDGRGLEIVWVDDPVDLFFLQIQGSGRVRLPGGRVLRVGYGGANGQPYSSIGSELVTRGVYEPHEVSAQVIRSWVSRNPEDGEELLKVNDSYVFFREVSEVPADKGPLGAMNRSITEGRSIAVDPAFVPLGAPVWLEKNGTRPMRRLMVAQDTGGAIKGAQRADVFYGTGAQAGLDAGKIRDSGRLVMLLPIQLAHALAEEPLS